MMERRPQDVRLPPCLRSAQQIGTLPRPLVHGSTGKTHRAQRCRRRPRDLLLVLGSEVLKHAVDVGEDEKRISFQRLGQDRCGEVLVDDSLDALELSFGAADDGDAASTGANNDGSGIQERASPGGSR